MNNTYFVKECFCSPNCAIAYNLDKGDYKTWERHSLIISLCHQLFGENIIVKSSPPRQCLKSLVEIYPLKNLKMDYY